jgi:hypothetical protein
MLKDVLYLQISIPSLQDNIVIIFFTKVIICIMTAVLLGQQFYTGTRVHLLSSRDHNANRVYNTSGNIN